MEGERRKRKLESEEEENEEQKMEKFFALIKSTKDARDLLFNKEKTDKKVEEGEDLKGKAAWTPMFLPEDFTGYGEFGRSSNVSTATPHADAGLSEKEKEVMEKEYLQEAAPAAPAPAAELKEEKEKASDHLDLNLSL